jgi:hypothetical protein
VTAGLLFGYGNAIGCRQENVLELKSARKRAASRFIFFGGATAAAAVVPAAAFLEWRSGRPPLPPIAVGRSD